MTRRTLELTGEERARLVRIRDRDPRAYLRERASALLQIADGRTGSFVAQHGLLRKRDPDTVYRWLNAYEASRSVPEHRVRRRRFSP